VLDREVHAPAPYPIAQDPDFGNDVLHLTLRPPIYTPIELSIDYRVRLGESNGSSRAASDEELRRSLAPDRLVILDEEIRRRAQQATAGRQTTTERARGIYEYVIQHMAYDKTTPGWGRGDTRRACRLGRGNCTDFHSLFISLARAEQIPARFKIGFVILPEATGTMAGYHCWAEFYDRETWVPVDASEAWKHPERADDYFGSHEPNRFLISAGRDLRLVPPQRGEPVNIFLTPYVEVDGQAFEQMTVECHFRDLKPQEGA
jgi:transglutaminase-like putative cysteine protease